MERIRGIILRRDIPAGLTFTPQEFRKLCEKLIDVHLQLHCVDYKAIGLENFGKPEGYVKRQVEGWSERFRNARTPDAPDYERIMAWLHEKMPPDCPKASVIHNDYRFDNVVLDPQDPLKIIGVLDWEMATVGDPLMDLGGALAYWVEKDDPPNAQVIRMVPTTVEGAFTRKEIVDWYAKRSGVPITNFDFYYCFGLFRLAVIAQQIYYRFYHGQTKDERFKLMIVVVQVLEETATGVIDQSEL
jgi:aminoglycoside phosphotransferase (APT) family kinase protein